MKSRWTYRILTLLLAVHAVPCVYADSFLKIENIPHGNATNPKALQLLGSQAITLSGVSFEVDRVDTAQQRPGSEDINIGIGTPSTIDVTMPKSTNTSMILLGLGMTGNTPGNGVIILTDAQNVVHTRFDLERVFVKRAALYSGDRFEQLQVSLRFNKINICRWENGPDGRAGTGDDVLVSHGWDIARRTNWSQPNSQSRCLR